MGSTEAPWVQGYALASWPEPVLSLSKERGSGGWPKEFPSPPVARRPDGAGKVASPAGARGNLQARRRRAMSRRAGPGTSGRRTRDSLHRGATCRKASARVRHAGSVVTHRRRQRGRSGVRSLVPSGVVWSTCPLLDAHRRTAGRNAVEMMCGPSSTTTQERAEWFPHGGPDSEARWTDRVDTRQGEDYPPTRRILHNSDARGVHHPYGYEA